MVAVLVRDEYYICMWAIARPRIWVDVDDSPVVGGQAVAAVTLVV